VRKLLGEMITIENYDRITSSASDIWNMFLRLNECYFDLSKNHISYKCIGGSPNSLGSIYKVREYFRGRQISIRYRLIEIVERNKIVLLSEFPHVLLGMKITYTLKEEENSTILNEKIEFGFSNPIAALIINPIIRLIISPYVQNIKSDQRERFTGIKKMFLKNEPELVEK